MFDALRAVHFLTKKGSDISSRSLDAGKICMVQFLSMSISVTIVMLILLCIVCCRDVLLLPSSNSWCTHINRWRALRNNGKTTRFFEEFCGLEHCSSMSKSFTFQNLTYEAFYFSSFVFRGFCFFKILHLRTWTSQFFFLVRNLWFTEKVPQTSVNVVEKGKFGNGNKINSFFSAQYWYSQLKKEAIKYPKTNEHTGVW